MRQEIVDLSKKRKMPPAEMDNVSEAERETPQEQTEGGGFLSKKRIKKGWGKGKKIKIAVGFFLVLIVLGGIIAWKKGFFERFSKEAKQKELALSVGGNTMQSKMNAIDIATDFLKKQDYASDYDLESAKAENFKDFWSVWFDKKDKDARPNKGLIQVQKETGEAVWKELY